MEAALSQGVTDLGLAFAGHPHVEAVALGGSHRTGRADPDSDVDLYVYVSSEVPVTFRAALAASRSDRSEIDNRFWETGDEWDDSTLGAHVDVIFRDTAWTEEQLGRVLVRHEPQLGYSTCLWHNIQTSKVVYDRHDWFATLQTHARRPYPEPLVHAIVGKNLPVLRSSFASYKGQILKAAARGDMVSVNHRVAAFLASYFDVLFAINRTLHPGEKRIIEAARELPSVPSGIFAEIERLLALTSQMDPSAASSVIDSLCDGLEAIRNGHKAAPGGE